VITQEASNILKEYVIELVKLLPDNWDSVDVYTEFSRLPGQVEPLYASRGSYIAEGKLNKDFHVSRPMYSKMRDFFFACEDSKNSWCGFRIKVFSNGRYKSKFYYDSTPLIDGNILDRDERLKEEI
jgi:hypothetical protein